jgi:hypothetical protein
MLSVPKLFGAEGAILSICLIPACQNKYRIYIFSIMANLEMQSPMEVFLPF